MQKPHYLTKRDSNLHTLKKADENTDGTFHIHYQIKNRVLVPDCHNKVLIIDKCLNFIILVFMTVGHQNSIFYLISSCDNRINLLEITS